MIEKTCDNCTFFGYSRCITCCRHYTDKWQLKDSEEPKPPAIDMNKLREEMLLERDKLIELIKEEELRRKKYDTE